MRLLIDPKTLRPRKEEFTTGVIYFAGDDFVFPSLTWSDFVATLIGAWWLELLRSKSDAEYEPVLSFMEGPFEVVGRRDTEGALVLEFLNLEEGVPLHRETSTVHEMLALMSQVARQVIDASENWQAIPQDVTSLIRVTSFQEPT